MERLFGNLATGRPPSPDLVVATVRDELADRNWSQGFLRAFDEFSSRYRAGDRLLEDHPFWAAIRSLSEGSAKAALHTFELEFHADFDGSAAYTVRTDDPDLLRILSFDGEAEPDPTSIDVDLAGILSLFEDDTRSLPQALRRCHAEGAIPFSEISWGVWRAERDPESANVRLLLRSDVARRASVAIDRSTAWGLGAPMSREAAETFLAVLRGHAPDRTGLVGVRIRGGVRMGDAYLGRARFLPQVRIGPGCTVSTATVGTAIGTLGIEVEGDTVSLNCQAPLDGVWRVDVMERGSVRARPSLVFEPDARLEPRRSADELAADWRPEEPNPVGCSPVPVELTDRGRVEPATDEALLDLLEAIYAAGSNGWAERDVIGAIGACLPDRFAGWDVLRLLVDSGWIEARVSKRWRARRWYVVPPFLTVFRSKAVMLEGAATAKLKRKLTEVAGATGALIETRATSADWSIPTQIVHTPDPEAIAAAIGLPMIEAAASLPPTDGPLRYDDTLYGDERRTVGSTWNWSKGRFVSYADRGSSGVILERLATSRLGAADIYRIVADGRTLQLLDGRGAAIALAHRVAGVPLFSFDGRERTLRRVASEGALPSAITRYLRLRNGCGPGLDFGEGGRGYVVSCEPSDAIPLKAWLGAALGGVDGGLAARDRLLRMVALGCSRGPSGARLVAGIVERSRQC